MIIKSPDYWQSKLSYWLHDPVCKVFDIKNHEKIATRIAVFLHQSIPEKDNYQAADCIASSLTRSLLPSYKEGGGIDFSDNTEVVHPLVKSVLKVDLPEIDIEQLCKEIESLLDEDVGLRKNFEEMQHLPENEKPLNAHFNYEDSPEDWAKALYNYLFFCFPKRLRNENIGGLGAIWDILPADTRMPDHPLWHHLGLVSAIGSTLDEDSNQQIDLVVFSITPVQDFIAKARKLRDYWTGSVLLSYLAFTGIASVMDNFGPDHVVYPSLHNQPLVDEWIKRQYRMKDGLLDEKGDLGELLKSTKGIAAFPNKFIFLCPHDKAQDIAKLITDTIQSKWIEISSGVKEYICKKTESSGHFSTMWDIQIEDFWKYSWASSKLAELSDKDKIEKLVSGDVVKNEYEVLAAFSTHFPNKTVRLYTSTHSLIQSVLAANKNKPTKVPRPQNGEKCPLCGEREVLHDFDLTGKTSAKDYSDGVKSFWDNLAIDDKNIRENERLCAVCAVKRFLPIMYKNFSKDKILQKVFNSFEKFPSTTELSANRFLKRLGEKHPIGTKDYEDILEFLHNQDNSIEDETDTEKLIRNSGVEFTDKDKYYAVLLMDGDKMGDLINGETLEATFEDIIHEDLVAKITNGEVKADVLKSYFGKKRNLNPALHAMISDSLNNFARFGVQPSIPSKGKLIYAGGDDVCAVLPLESALDCAKKIAESYTLSFATYSKEGATPIEKLNPSMSKVGYHLGHDAKGISISGAIIIAHHKQPLKEVVQESHSVLDSIAKEKSGRNSLAIRLKKRSGGSRDMWFKWDDKNIFSSSQKSFHESFMAVVSNAGVKLSSSLLYKIESLKQSIEPLVNDISANKELILKLFEYEVAHSIFSKKEQMAKARELAEDLAGICIKVKTNDSEIVASKDWYNPETAIIAHFLGGLEKREKK